MIEFTVFKGSKEGKIIKSTTQKELKADEVLIRTTHSGLCGTDEHYKHVEMGLGHEGAGVVEVNFFSSSSAFVASSDKYPGSRCISQDLEKR
jgi:threonine dehydrogenase-like Zn-dependent dehydrogenase